MKTDNALYKRLDGIVSALEANADHAHLMADEFDARVEETIKTVEGSLDDLEVVLFANLIARLSYIKLRREFDSSPPSDSRAEWGVDENAEVLHHLSELREDASPVARGAGRNGGMGEEGASDDVDLAASLHSTRLTESRSSSSASASSTLEGGEVEGEAEAVDVSDHSERLMALLLSAAKCFDVDVGGRTLQNCFNGHGGGRGQFPFKNHSL